MAKNPYERIHHRFDGFEIIASDTSPGAVLSGGDITVDPKTGSVTVNSGGGGSWDGGIVKNETIFEKDVTIAGYNAWLLFNNTNAGSGWDGIPSNAFVTKSHVDEFLASSGNSWNGGTVTGLAIFNNIVTFNASTNFNYMAQFNNTLTASNIFINDSSRRVRIQADTTKCGFYIAPVSETDSTSVSAGFFVRQSFNQYLAEISGNTILIHANGKIGSSSSFLGTVINGNSNAFEISYYNSGGTRSVYQTPALENPYHITNVKMVEDLINQNGGNILSSNNTFTGTNRFNQRVDMYAMTVFNDRCIANDSFTVVGTLNCGGGIYGSGSIQGDVFSFRYSTANNNNGVIISNPAEYELRIASVKKLSFNSNQPASLLRTWVFDSENQLMSLKTPNIDSTFYFPKNNGVSGQILKIDTDGKSIWTNESTPIFPSIILNPVTFKGTSSFKAISNFDSNVFFTEYSDTLSSNTVNFQGFTSFTKRATFSGEVIVPTPINDTNAANKKYVDDRIPVDSVPIGTILPFWSDVVPSGFLLCNGGLVSKITYSALYATKGLGWAQTVNDFYLPAMTGRFMKGSNGTIGGAGSNPVGTYEEDAIRNIAGTISIHSSEKGSILYGGTGAFSNNAQSQYLVPSPAMPTATGATSLNKIEFSAANTGMLTASENRPKNVSVIYGIKY